MVVLNYTSYINRSMSAIRKFGLVEILDMHELSCCDEVVLACFDEGVVACLDNNSKDDFDVYFLLVPPLGYIIEETLVCQNIFHNGYMKNIC